MLGCIHDAWRKEGVVYCFKVLFSMILRCDVFCLDGEASDSGLASWGGTSHPWPRLWAYRCYVADWREGETIWHCSPHTFPSKCPCRRLERMWPILLHSGKEVLLSHHRRLDHFPKRMVQEPLTPVDLKEVEPHLFLEGQRNTTIHPSRQGSCQKLQALEAVVGKEMMSTSSVVPTQSLCMMTTRTTRIRATSTRADSIRNAGLRALNAREQQN